MIRKRNSTARLRVLGAVILAAGMFIPGPINGASWTIASGVPFEVRADALYQPCGCVAKVDPRAPMELRLANNGTVALFSPQYSDRGTPSCSSGSCQEKVSYRWTIQVMSGDPQLFHADQGVAQIQGFGRFKLCMKVKVECFEILGSSGGHTVRAITTCEDSGCAEFSYW